MNIQLAPGTFRAGFSRPFFISDGMIADKLAEYGISDFEIASRGEKNPPYPPSKTPGDWDEWIEVRYHGDPKRIELKKHWDWLIYEPFPDEAPEFRPTVYTDNPGPSPVGIFLIGLAVDLVFFKLIFGRKK